MEISGQYIEITVSKMEDAPRLWRAGDYTHIASINIVNVSYQNENRVDEPLADKVLVPLALHVISNPELSGMNSQILRGYVKLDKPIGGRYENQARTS